MPTQIVQIGRHRFLCGLFWQSLSRRHELRAEAAGLAARLNFDAMVLRIDRGFAGAGFASTREGAQLGLPSLGALVSKAIATEGAFYDGRQQPAPNWLGAFSLPDGRWAYFAVRDGAFLPNGDWVATTDEVFERLHSDYSLGGWNVVIGDPRIEAQGFHNFYARDIEDMIPRRGGKAYLPRWLNLAPVSRRLQWRRIGIAAALCAALGVAAWGALRYRESRHEAARQLALEQAREQRRLHPPSQAAPPPVMHPWATAPLPSTFVRSCLENFVLIAPGGWQLDDYVCRATNVSYSWSRDESNVALLMAAQPHAVIDTSGNHATLVVPVSLAASGDENIERVHGVRLRMLSAFQRLGVPLSFTLQRPVTPQTSLAADALGKFSGGSEATWQTWRLSANLGELAPGNVVKYLDEPGVRLDKVSYRSGQWTVEGVIYEK
ncbi:type 4b pilus protein PilO2 [Paraburkholderia humisilvae]|uniref:PilO family protein n=1 Tax=Paraburkholderia humisilvae TaxID=627669 RepID=A0A6J5F1C6_9BURK|nr:type 4b pilus protein PilO2 [Paraburkholderia humisilvae]CAB3772183.1 hypothetical protein LMG29542_06814 [Paraburkholderia humisilvae]